MHSHSKMVYSNYSNIRLLYHSKYSNIKSDIRFSPTFCEYQLNQANTRTIQIFVSALLKIPITVCKCAQLKSGFFTLVSTCTYVSTYVRTYYIVL